MRKTAAAFLSAALVAASPACRPARPNLAPRPERLGFPLMEAGTLPFEGTANGPVRVRFDIAYFSTAEGFLYSIDILSQRIIWRFKADRPVSVAPELGEDTVSIRDEGNTVYVLDADGHLLLKTTPPDSVTTPVRERMGRIYFGCGTGRTVALDLRWDGQAVWEFMAGSAVRSGPVFSRGLVIFGIDDGRILALNDEGRPVWTFAAKGAVRVDPASSTDRIFFGTVDRYYYSLEAATGKKKWVFRLAGFPMHQSEIVGNWLVLAASDSIVYRLNARSGEILWWRAVPSRIVYKPVVADGLVLVSALSPDVSGYDLRGGYGIGSYRAAGDLLAGARWVSPYLFVIESDPASTGERIVFLRRDRRPVETLGKENPIRR